MPQGSHRGKDFILFGVSRFDFGTLHLERLSGGGWLHRQGTAVPS